METGYKIAVWAIAGLIAGFLIGWWTIKTPLPADIFTSKQVELQTTMRRLWEDHITWTRLAIISIANNSEDKTANIDRLLENPADMAAGLAPYYGNDGANQFKDLLSEHLTIAAEFVENATAENVEEATDAETRWFKNADDLASFLSSANPNWPEANLKEMLYSHLSLTKSEASNIIIGNYAESVADYDRIHNQALQMSDTLSDGIIAQFPDRF